MKARVQVKRLFFLNRVKFYSIKILNIQNVKLLILILMIILMIFNDIIKNDNIIKK